MSIIPLVLSLQPLVTPDLADVLHSKTPANLSDSKRRKLSRADSTPPPVVFDAKYHHKIAFFTRDIATSSKLIYQLSCVRAMALLNDTQPASEPTDEEVPVEEGDVVEAVSEQEETLQTAKNIPKKKKWAFSFCG